LKIKPIHLVITGLIAVALIYFFGKTTPPIAQQSAVMDSGHAGNQPQSTVNIDLHEIEADAKKKLPNSTVQLIDSLNNQLAKNPSDINVLKTLSQTWQKAGSKIIVAEYAHKIAEKTNKPADYALAGDKLVIAFENASDSNLSKSLADEAFDVLQHAIELDTNNIDNKVNLAAILMESRNQVMEGVPILKDAVKKMPEHLKANFILAKFAVVSGQYDKAITRLIMLNSKYPDYTDAYLVLAKAYTAKGEMMKAKATLQTCQKHLTDAQAKAEVQQMIEKFN